MSRYVAVRYLVPIYATVDLDGDEGVVQVQQGCSDIVRLDDQAGVAWLTGGDLLAESYVSTSSRLIRPASRPTNVIGPSQSQRRPSGLSGKGIDAGPSAAFARVALSTA